MKQHSQRVWTIFEDGVSGKERIPLYQNYQTGKIMKKISGRKEEIRNQLRMYDGDFSELMEEVSMKKHIAIKMNG
ncbi:MAG: hypothetical protein ACLR7S_15225 [Dorea longicatena]